MAADLAPGDGRSADLDVRAFCVEGIPVASHPLFSETYGVLWQEFGSGGEMEREEIIAARLRRSLSTDADGWTLCYQLLAVHDPEGWAAVRDHTVVLPPAERNGASSPVVVHLSHLLVAPRWRRRGLAGWMRAMPLQAARDCQRASPGFPDGGAVTLVAEMEPLLPGRPERAARMLAYGKAGFRQVDPSAVRYFQPDFRAPAVIDATGGPCPLPMDLVVRRVGREGEQSMDGAEARAMVDSLYRVFAADCRACDMEPLRQQLRCHHPPPGERVALLSPRELSAA